MLSDIVCDIAIVYSIDLFCAHSLNGFMHVFICDLSIFVSLSQQEFRIVGTNKIGMLAWHVTMKTPEYPDGREIVVIANDVTVQSGSFGVRHSP